jgi:hypothetical protein
MTLVSPFASTDKEFAEHLAKIFKEVDWLIPAYLSRGFVTKFAQAIEDSPSDQKLATVRSILGNVYNAEYLATMLLERYSKIIHVKDFAPQIDESIKAFFSGYKIVAVVALVPVVEGIVRKMATRQDRDIGKGTKKLKEEFALLVERERASPHCYGERLVMLEVLRDFISERFLKETSSYDGLNNFNRHGIVHAIYDQYGDDLNFFRLITLLDLLCFAIGMIEGGVSSFAPETTPDSARLARHYRWLQKKVASARRRAFSFDHLLAAWRRNQPARLSRFSAADSSLAVTS